ncbi:uncharacterized protein LOC122322438 [Drosophila grimshawi]|uniref:uncharacterized protein LOC122322438 n=1 Tax=Drosophila grimshawi TaxID=7222 RepID=UPI001C934EE5|nr:uncharacterized protein LOC122322438 [Drosophila grimshawi]
MKNCVKKQNDAEQKNLRHIEGNGSWISWPNIIPKQHANRAGQVGHLHAGDEEQFRVAQIHNLAVMKTDAHTKEVIINACYQIKESNQSPHMQPAAEKECKHADHADEFLEGVSHLADWRIEKVAHNALLLNERR